MDWEKRFETRRFGAGKIKVARESWVIIRVRLPAVSGVILPMQTIINLLTENIIYGFQVPSAVPSGLACTTGSRDRGARSPNDSDRCHVRTVTVTRQNDLRPCSEARATCPSKSATSNLTARRFQAGRSDPDGRGDVPHPNDVITKERFILWPRGHVFSQASLIPAINKIASHCEIRFHNM